MAAINYAQEYSSALAQAYPFVLNFGALYATPNNGRYRMGEDGKGIYIPRISTSGRVDSSRDSIGFAQRNYDNSWEYKPLSHQRKWSTLLHPKDVDQTNGVATITNITQVFNETQKFPEMDAYLISQLYYLWTHADTSKDAEDVAKTAIVGSLSASNILENFDTMMLNMDEDLVPANGRLLYITSQAHKLLKQAEGLVREFSVQNGGDNVSRIINRLDEVEIIPVPSTLMKTLYSFTSGWAVDDNAAQINMFLVHPTAVITPVSYEFAQLDEPTAMSNGKYVYFEESFEDVFILNKRKGALQFHVTNP